MEGDGEPPAFMSIDTDPNEPENVIAGSGENDIWLVRGHDSGEPAVLVEGQSSDVYGIAAYPLPVGKDKAGAPLPSPQCYASGCEDGSVYIWNAATKENLMAFAIRRGDDQKPTGCYRGELLKVKAVTFR